MSIEQMKGKLHGIWEKISPFKYTALILLLGIGLMVFPKDTAPSEPVAVEQPETEDLERRLEILLRQIAGAGEVQVLLTLAEGTSYEYQTNRQETAHESETQLQTETVLASRGSGQEEPVAVRTWYPVYRGAVVLCTGADRASVRLDVVRAVSSVTGLGSDKISVIKMKEH